jgi:hypothetical protein
MASFWAVFAIAAGIYPIFSTRLPTFSAQPIQKCTPSLLVHFDLVITYLLRFSLMMYYAYSSVIHMSVVHDLMISSLVLLCLSILPVVHQLYQHVQLRERKLFLLVAMGVWLLLEGFSWLFINTITYTFGVWLALDALYFGTFILLSHYQAKSSATEVLPTAASGVPRTTSFLKAPLLSNTYGYAIPKSASRSVSRKSNPNTVTSDTALSTGVEG